MQRLEKNTSDLVARIQSFLVFQDIDAAPLTWLVERSEYKCYDLGEIVFKPGQRIDHMQIVMQGRCSVEFEQNGELRPSPPWETGDVMGLLPFSRMKAAKAWGRALEPCYLLELHRDHFIEMVNQSYELTQALVGAMSDRVRDFTQLRSQNEKLISLGKISAGLAHELNNPAAAMVRSAAELYRRQHQTPERFKAIMTMRVTDEQTDAVNAILFSKIQHVKGVELPLMEREARKDDLLDWLDSHDIPDSEELAETLVEFDFTEADLLEINKIVNGQHLKSIIRWIEGTLSLERLVHEIRESASRIATLVQSVKSYSHMDRGVGMEPVPVQEGIRSTLVMLQHKIKQKRIQVVKNFSPDLPDAQGYPGEINQVWTNLIDNAIDAMPEEGTLTITTHHDPHFINVAIHDTGVGIPEELQTQIFDPFFTTKPMGQGTGLGLDVVNKIIFHHRGDIRVESQPGSTTFTVALPINGASST